MRLRAFLSHKRQRQAPVLVLRDELRLRGIGGWKDTEDFPVGEAAEPEIKRTIEDETGGFIWWATADTLESRMITKLEIPTAMKRKRRDPGYPIVPLFVELRPGADRKRIARALGRWPFGSVRAKRLLDLNGLILERGETIEEFVRRAADRYAHDAIRSLSPGPVAASFTVFRDPRPDQELTFDWRPVFDAENRELVSGALERLSEALDTALSCLKSGAAQPEVRADLDLPLPLAYLVGFEWRITTGMRLSVLQRTGTIETLIDGDGRVEWPVSTPKLDIRGNPVVIAVSTPWPISEAARRYASHVGAELIELHAPDLLSPAEIRGLARTAGGVLKHLNDAGVEKHLLIRGPAALASFIGTAANATGWTIVPFWNRDRFVNPLRLG